MRIVSATVGGLGAGLGLAKGLIVALGALLVGATGTGIDPFIILWAGTEAGIALSCTVGLIGVAYALKGRMRTAALLMAFGAAGVAISAAVYVLLQPAALGSAFEPYLSPGLLPVTRWHAQALFPIPFLLVGAILAFLAYNIRNNPGPSGGTA